MRTATRTRFLKRMPPARVWVGGWKRLFPRAGASAVRATTAHEDRHAHAFSHGTGGGGSGCVSFPTVIVTVDFGGAFVLPAGLCSSTIPSRPGSLTSWLCTLTLKPAASSVSRADCSSWLVTSGTVMLVGPFETLSVIVEPGGAEPLGSSFTTVFFGCSLWTSCRATAKPAFWSSELARSNCMPTTFGTVTAAGPLDTLILTRLFLTTVVPPTGDCAVTVPTALFEGTRTTGRTC